MSNVSVYVKADIYYRNNLGRFVLQGLTQVKKRTLVARTFLLSALLATATAQAQECATHYPSVGTTASMFDMAVNIRNSLDALSPRVDVVMLARGGQDLSRFGLIYSHLSFALRDADGQWRVVHELNVCKTNHSDLYREGLVEFVGESVLRADVLVVVPNTNLQERLKQILTPTGEVARALHEPRYSLVSYPFSTRYQNSNQWVLEVLVAATMPASGRSVSREDIQAQLKQKGYVPSTLHIKLHERLAARLWVDNATTVDHPASERLSGNYSVVTVDSVVDFMKKEGWASRVFTVSRPDGQLVN